MTSLKIFFGSTPSGPQVYTLTAEPGSYVYTGQTAGLLHHRLVSAGVGSYSYSGEDASLLKLYSLAAGVSSYSLAGMAIGLLYHRLLSAATSSYSLSGVAAGLLWHRTVSAGIGAYIFTGYDADLVYTGGEEPPEPPGDGEMEKRTAQYIDALRGELTVSKVVAARLVAAGIWNVKRARNAGMERLTAIEGIDRAKANGIRFGQ